jgi:MFS family permease
LRCKASTISRLSQCNDSSFARSICRTAAYADYLRGTIVTFGTYQSYYETVEWIDASPTTIAWIGSVQAFLLLFVGALTGQLFDAGYLRLLLWAGTFFITFGLMMASLARAFWQLLLAQGFCVGLGLGCLLVPSVGTPSTWFIKHRGLAIGCVTAGAAVGGVVLPISQQRLIKEVGFPWAIRIAGFMSLATMSISLAIMRQRLPPRKRGGFFEFSALKEVEFSLYVSGMLFGIMGFYQPYNYIQSWADTIHLNTHGLQTFYYLPIMNSASIIGRMLPTFLSDTLGPLNVQAPALFISAILVFGWLGISTFASSMVFAILYGISSGTLIALPPAAVASLTTDMTKFGSRMGLCFVFMSVGSLIGGPVTGAIVQGPGFNGARIFIGVVLVVGGCFMSCSRTWIARREGRFLMKI